MKTKLYFLSFSILFSTATFCQSFVNSSNKWYNKDCCAVFGGNSCITYEYTFGDTVTIGMHDYRALVTDNNTPLFDIGAFYREENGLVFMKTSETAEEILIYDFNLEVGDLITIGNSLLELQVIAIDSIELNSGEMRKRLELGTTPNASLTTYWIEGIGSINSPMNTQHMFTLDCWNELNCFHIEDNVEYQLGNCELGTDASSTELDHSQETISTYPNPVVNTITINSDINIIQSLEIFDTQGKRQLFIDNLESNILNLSQLKNGIYILKITNKNQQITANKLIKL